MGKINIVISDDTEQRFRQTIAKYKGFKKGDISEAVEDAINLWIVDKVHFPPGKT